MFKPFLKPIALGLAFCLILVGGVVSAQMVGHAAHHAHHKAGTHGTAVCAWMCAAGQVINSQTTPLLVSLGPTVLVPALAIEAPATPTSFSLASRGPPPTASI